MTPVGLVALNALFLVAGLGILWGLRGWRTWRSVVADAGLAFVLGLCATVVLATLTLMAGAGLSSGLVVALALLVAAAGGSVGRLRRHPLPSQRSALGRPRTFGQLLAAVPAAVAALVTLALLWAFRHQPLVAYDAWNFWIPKAKTIYFFGGLDEQLFRTLPAPSYPLLVPTLDAMVFHFVHAVDPSALAIEYWFLFVGFLTAAAALLDRIARRGLVWLFLAIAAVLPEVEHRWFQLLADWPLDVFFALSALLVVRWLYTRETWLLGALPITAAATLATKREGQLLIAALLLGALAATARERRRHWPVLVGAGVLAFAATQLPWTLWWRSRNLRSSFTEGGIGHLGGLHRVWPSLRIVAELTFGYHLWLLAVPLALAAVLLAATRREHRPAAALYGVTSLVAALGFAWVIWSTPSMPLNTNPASNPTVREVASLALLSIVLTPVLATGLLAELPLPALDLAPREALQTLPARARAWLVGLQPRTVLVGAIVAQWLIVLGIAAKVRHAGWLYYQGGDQLWYYTSAWVLAHGHMPWPAVGYLWSILLAPLSLVAGPDILQALPAIVIIDVVVLLPIALLALYGIATRIGGRLFAYWTLLAWLLLPLFGIVYTNGGYHQRYTELLLPQGLGLSAMADFPAMVATLVSAYFAARTLFDERPRVLHGVAAGLAAGAAIGIKPSAALFLAGPALAYLAARRWRHAGAFVAALAPALLTLVLWKWRGFGHLAFGHAEGGERLALAGIGAPAAALNSNFDWAHLSHEFDFLREYFWSGRLIQWAAVAGAVGLGRRSRVALALAGGWFGAYLVAKGTYVHASLQDGSLLRLMIPAFPAFVLMLAALPLLLPRLVRGLQPIDGGLPEPSPRLRTTLLVGGILLTAIVPIAAIAAAHPMRATHPYAAFVQQPAIPTDVDLGLRALPSPGGGVSLTWRPQRPAGGPVFFHVFRQPADQPQYSYCETGRASSRCQSNYSDIAAVRETAYVDHPGKGTWRYRVGLAANWLDDPTAGDVYLISTSVQLSVP